MDKIGPPTSCLVENRHSACFDILSEEEKEILAKNTVDIRYKKGEVIAKFDDLLFNVPRGRYSIQLFARLLLTLTTDNYNFY